jgi:ribosomal protein S6
MPEELAVKKDIYELSFHLNPNLQGESLTTKVNSIKNEVTSLSGLITKFRDTKRVRLAYPIRHNFAANFGIIEFTAPRKTISALKNKLALDETILRTLIVKKEAEPAKERKEYGPAMRKKKVPEKPAVSVEPKELEKELERILEKL